MDSKKSYLFNSRGKEVKGFELTTIGLNVMVDPLGFLKAQKTSILVPDDTIWRPNMITTDPQMRIDESRIFNMYGSTSEHPYQAVVIATNEEMESKGFKVGTIIYCGDGLFRSRSVLQVNGLLYPVVSISQIYAIAGHKQLENSKIISLNF